MECLSKKAYRIALTRFDKEIVQEKYTCPDCGQSFTLQVKYDEPKRKKGRRKRKG